MRAKTMPVAVTLTPETERWIAAEAQRLGRSKGAILAALAEEAVRTRRFPGIAFRGPEPARRAWLVGTALDVWEVIEAVHDAGSVEAALTLSDHPEPMLRLALAYAQSYPDEIERTIADNRNAERLHRLHPSLAPAPST